MESFYHHFISRKFSQLRVEHKESFEEVENATGIPVITLQGYEEGRRVPLPTALRLLAHYGEPDTRFLEWVGEFNTCVIKEQEVLVASMQEWERYVSKARKDSESLHEEGGGENGR